MLKRNIKFTDYNDTPCVEEHYFNLTDTELIELEVEYNEGLGATIEKIVATEDRKGLIAIFKKLVLQAYGQKSPDGKSFRKSEAMRDEFSQTAAYSALFMELATNADAAAEFIKGIVPASMGASIDQQTAARIGAETQPAIDDLAVRVASQFSPPPPPPSAFEATRVDL